jgi:hypothetical protein
MTLPVTTGKCVAIVPVGGALDSLGGVQFNDYIFEATASGASPAITNGQLIVRTNITGFCTVGATVYSHLEPQP